MYCVLDKIPLTYHSPTRRHFGEEPDSRAVATHQGRILIVLMLAVRVQQPPQQQEQQQQQQQQQQHGKVRELKERSTQPRGFSQPSGRRLV